jgi:hypothetical protein
MANQNVVGATIRATVKRNAGGNMYRARLPRDRAVGIFVEMNMRHVLLFL